MCRDELRLLSLFLLFAGWASSSAGSKPNIVIIMADDMGFNDVGFHGGDVKTPNLDALAGHGVVLNRHYSQPCCTPSRAALMTGKYPTKIGMAGPPLPAGVPKGLPLDLTIFPQYFQDLGYTSHLVGKWHLGFETWSHMPTNRGFDSFFGYLNGYLGYYDGTHTQSGLTGRDFRRDEMPIWEEVYGQYLTGILTKEAVSVIHSHPGSDGLLLFLNHAAPHTGNLNFYREAPPNTNNFTTRQIYSEMVRWLDDSVGEVVTALNRKGILNNTVIVFMSDNGAPTVDLLYGYSNYGSNWPLRGLKLSGHEGGVRTAALVWSSLIPHPRISNDLFHITDWLPTLYTAAGGRLSNFNELDGFSQWHSLVSGSSGPRNEILINMDNTWNNEVLIRRKWKIIKSNEPSSNIAFSDKYYGESGRNSTYDPFEVESSKAGKILGRPRVPYQQVREQATVNGRCLDSASAESSDCYNKYCLYDIFSDPTECRDLSAEYPAVVSQLQDRLAAFRQVMVPSNNKTMDPRSDPAYWGDFWSPWMDSGASLPKLRVSLLAPIFLVLELGVFERGLLDPQGYWLNLFH